MYIRHVSSSVAVVCCRFHGYVRKLKITWDRRCGGGHEVKYPFI